MRVVDGRGWVESVGDCGQVGRTLNLNGTCCICHCLSDRVLSAEAPHQPPRCPPALPSPPSCRATALADRISAFIEQRLALEAAAAALEAEALEEERYNSGTGQRQVCFVALGGCSRIRVGEFRLCRIRGCASSGAPTQGRRLHPNSSLLIRPPRPHPSTLSLQHGAVTPVPGPTFTDNHTASPAAGTAGNMSRAPSPAPRPGSAADATGGANPFSRKPVAAEAPENSPGKGNASAAVAAAAAKRKAPANGNPFARRSKAAKS